MLFAAAIGSEDRSRRQPNDQLMVLCLGMYVLVLLILLCACLCQAREAASSWERLRDGATGREREDAP